MADNNLARLARGDVSTNGTKGMSRGTARAAQQVFDDVRLAALKSEGAVALGGHVMDGVVQLDEHRRNLDRGDPVLQVILTEIEATTIQQMRRIQREVYGTEWGF